MHLAASIGLWDRMIRYSSDKNKRETVICASLLGLTPMIMALVYCAINGGAFSLPFLPDSGWNDELLYYKMTEAVLTKGFPTGYFGYNESHAEILSFATWNPLMLLGWVIFGKLFGWGLNSPYYSNIFYISCALFLFGLLTRIDKRKTGILIFLFLSLKPIGRYLLSCTPETFVYSLIIICLGLCVSRINRKEKITIGYVVAVSTLLILLIHFRPYLLLLFFLPIYCVYKAKKSGVMNLQQVTGSFMLIIAAVLFSIISYVFVTKHFTAEYQEESLYTDWIEAFFDGGIKYGFVYFVKKVHDSLYKVY